MSETQISVEQEHTVGELCVIESMSPLTAFAVIFEDDGAAAHFHGLDTSNEQSFRLDLLHVYDVKGVEDAHLPVVLQIVWSGDGLKVALLLNGVGHAVFDFAAQRGYCRNNKPKPNLSWTAYDHEWVDEVAELF